MSFFLKLPNEILTEIVKYFDYGSYMKIRDIYSDMLNKLKDKDKEIIQEFLYDYKIIYFKLFERFLANKFPKFRNKKKLEGIKDILDCSKYKLVNNEITDIYISGSTVTEILLKENWNAPKEKFGQKDINILFILKDKKISKHNIIQIVKSIPIFKTNFEITFDKYFIDSCNNSYKKYEIMAFCDIYCENVIIHLIFCTMKEQYKHGVSEDLLILNYIIDHEKLKQYETIYAQSIQHDHTVPFKLRTIKSRFMTKTMINEKLKGEFDFVALENSYDGNELYVHNEECLSEKKFYFEEFVQARIQRKLKYSRRGFTLKDFDQRQLMSLIGIISNKL